MTPAAALLAAAALAASAAAVPAPDPRAIADLAAGRRTDANAAWWGFDPADATAALQAAIRSGAKTVVVPDVGRPWLVGPIFLESGQTIELERGVEILARPGGFRGKSDTLFRLEDKSDVVIRGYGAVLRMRKEDYRRPPYAKSEYRDCLGIYGGSNIKVQGLTLAGSGGDGVYIAGSRERPYSKDVALKDVVLADNYRQGVSVISVDGLLIENAVIRGTGGTKPGAGIDFEPNKPSDRLSGVKLRNCVIERNESYGIWVYTGNLGKSSIPVSIEIEGGRVAGNGRGALFVDSGKAKGAVTLTGVALEGERKLDLTDGFTVEVR